MKGFNAEAIHHNVPGCRYHLVPGRRYAISPGACAYVLARNVIALDDRRLRTAAHNPKVAGSNPAPVIKADKAQDPKKPCKPADRDLEGHRKVAFVVAGRNCRTDSRVWLEVKVLVAMCGAAKRLGAMRRSDGFFA
jgi:hypothetical protein